MTTFRTPLAKDPIEAFKQLADVFAAIRDPQERAAFGAEALGKSWQGAAPLLAEGGKAIDEMVEKGKRLSKVSEESAAKADELNDLLVDLKGSSTGAAVEFANLLVPSLTDTAKAMEDLASKGSPVLALLRGFAGLGKLPFDLALGSVDTSVKGQIKDLEAHLSDLKTKRTNIGNAGGGLINEWVFGKPGELDQAILVATNQLDALKKYGDVTKSAATPATPATPAPEPNLKGFLGSSNGNTGSKIPRARAESYTDPLAEAAKFLAGTLNSLDQAQAKANASGETLTTTQSELVHVMADPRFAQMPEGWQEIIKAQAGYVIETEKAAEAQRILNDLMAATPTGQLEKQREIMRVLAAAHNAGKISDVQLTEGIQTALGTVPEVAKDAEKSFIDLTTVANDAARSMSGAFVDFLFDPMEKSIGDMLLSFLKATAKMIAQAAMLQLVQAGMAAMGFPVAKAAKGAAFDGNVQPFALGGVVTRQTPFRFASGGSFKSGVMGEAGPEAILPLQRGQDGKLGVTMNGGASSGSVNISIVVNEGDGTDSKNTTGDTAGAWGQFAERVKGMILQEMTIQKRPGGLLYA